MQPFFILHKDVFDMYFSLELVYCSCGGCSTLFQMAILWFGWQAGIGWLAWSTARFYSNNCAAPGFSGFISSLSTMGSPICLGAWFSHAAFVVAYITAFVVAVLVVVLWLWNRIIQDRGYETITNRTSAFANTNSEKNTYDFPEE